MRVLLVGDDANDQNLQQKGAPFYIAFTRHCRILVYYSVGNSQSERDCFLQSVALVVCTHNNPIAYARDVEERPR